MPSAHGVFAYASPIFIVAAWPVVVWYRRPLVLWYLHRANPLMLRLAVRLATSVVTADAASLTFSSPKVIAVGHGILTERFPVRRSWDDVTARSLRIVSVGRITPIKDFATLIRATALMVERGRAVTVRIIGVAGNLEQRQYEQQLKQLVRDERLDDTVTFPGKTHFDDMPSQYAWADIVVGCTPPGGIDKALLEGMASGCAVVTSNTVMRTMLGRYADASVFPHGDASALAERIQAAIVDERTSLAMARIVAEHHDLHHTIARIMTRL